MAGICLEFAQFGHFDSFDIIRSMTSMVGVADVDLPTPIATGLKTMYYVDTNVIEGNVYFYKVRVWRGATSFLSSEISIRAERDEYWAYVKALLHFDGNLTDASGNTTYQKYGSGDFSYSDNYAVAGKSARMNGLSVYVAPENRSLWSLAGEAFCLELTFTINSVRGGTNGLLSKWHPGVTSLCEYHIYFDSSGVYVDIRKSNPLGYVSLLSGPLPSLNTKTKLAFTYDGTTYRLFLNGVLVSSNFSGALINFAPNQSVFIGAQYDFNWWFDGYFDELRLTKGVPRYISAYTPIDIPFPDQ